MICGSIHCKDNEPEKCAENFSQLLKNEKIKKVGFLNNQSTVPAACHQVALQLANPCRKLRQGCVLGKYRHLFSLNRISILIKTLAAFSSQPAGLDVFAQQGTGSIFGILETAVKGFHDRQTGIKTNEIGQR